MELVDGSSRRTIVMDRFPFVIGRSSECNLALPQSYVSRSHATITCDGTQYVLEDTQSRHGTFVNGEQVTRHMLRRGDSLQFGSRDAPQLRFAGGDRHTATGPNILSQLQGISAKHSDLEKLRWFLEAARDLNSTGQVDRVLASLLETTLALAKVERGYVFLTGTGGALELALGRDAAGKVLTDAPTVSRTVLQIAARIQQGLMAVQIPAFPFAGVQAHSIACSAVGGDFFDVISGEDVLNVALVDVSGKGISAAILASTLQGMLHVQLEAGQPLDAIATATNRYLCLKAVGKYATMLLLRLHQDGTLEYLNCGHVQPRLCSDAGISRLEQSNVPVGLLEGAEYMVGVATLRPGSRLILVSDGVTEAEDAQGEFFGDERLDSASLCGALPEVLQRMADFCAGHPATDDCTIVQVMFSGSASDGGGPQAN